MKFIPTFKSTQQKIKLIPKCQNGNFIKYRTGYDPELRIERIGFIDLPEIVVTPDADDYRRLALDRSRRATSPTVNFDNAIDLSFIGKLNANYDGHTCLNTVTSFYGPQYTGAVNREFVVDPQRYGFKQIPQKQALPGDIIILSDQTNHPNHAVIFDSVAKKDGISPQGKVYIKGDTLVNYSNGSQKKDGYRKQNPISVYLGPDAGGDFTGVKRYFRFTGERE